MSDERPDRASRPSPDALLQEAKRGERGRLKIFLGAAPGVGKTYEMLVQARQRRFEDAGVAIGVVETHGRIETEMLTKGFDKIPKKRILYKGRVLAEMDLEGILLRKPKLVLVDELAHTNVPGSLHPKRYLDVEELLNAGIDVYSTLNVQHIESLNDVVAKITRVHIRETVPDSILERADAVELVDLTPDDLLQRLKEGKVYVPERAERAVQNYFRPGNLAALRELALRHTAKRVDDQLLTYMRAHAIHGPWEASERVLVLIDETSGSPALIRYARRLADRLRAAWSVIYVETPHARQISEANRDRIAETLRIAERLGGQAVTIPGVTPAEGITDYAHANNFTHIVVSGEERGWWSDALGTSTVHAILRRASDISIHVVPAQLSRAMKGRRAWPLDALWNVRPSTNGRAYLGSVAIAVVALGISLLLRQFLGVNNVALVFLTAILASAITFGLWPSLLACFVSVLALNFFFMPPYYMFTVENPENVVALFFFGAVAVIASNLAARVRAQAIVARERAKMTEDLYLFSRKLAGVLSLDDLLWATAYQIAQMLKVRVVVLLPEGSRIAVRAGYPPEDTLDEGDLAAANWSWEHARAAGRGADTLPGGKRLFLPMRTGRGMIGVVGLDSDRGGALLSPDQRRLLDALVDQAALAIERINLAEDIDRARLAAETERLRSALLTSLSHDLRTPLASIVGSASTLKNLGDTLEPAARDEMIGTIQEEAERLNRFIANLLDMTRLESGALEPSMEFVDLGDIIGSALRRAGKVLNERKIELELAPDLPMLRADPVLLEQVLFNLLDNAAKYSQPGTVVRIEAHRDGRLLKLEILDGGEGIPPGDLERIFDKFYRVYAADHRRAGTGLGLAICRGFIEAMGGTIVAGNRIGDKGAVFTISLPVPADTGVKEPAA